MTGRRALLVVESSTSGTGRIVRAARELAFAPVLLTARPERYARLSEYAAPEVVVVPRIGEDEPRTLIASRFDGGAAVAGITSSPESHAATSAPA